MLGTKRQIFDNDRIAAELTRITRDPWDGKHLPIRSIKFLNKDTLQFEVESSQDTVIKDAEAQRGDSQQTQRGQANRQPPTKKKVWHFKYSLVTQTLTEIPDFLAPDNHPAWASVSPDGQTIVYGRKYNLYKMTKARVSEGARRTARQDRCGRRQRRLEGHGAGNPAHRRRSEGLQLARGRRQDRRAAPPEKADAPCQGDEGNEIRQDLARRYPLGHRLPDLDEVALAQAHGSEPDHDQSKARRDSREAASLRYRGRRRPRIDQSFADWLNPEIEPLEGTHPQQREIPGLTEDHFVRRPLPRHVDVRRAGPALQHRPVGLPEPPQVVVLDPQGLEYLGGNPGQLRPGIDQHALNGTSLAGARRILDLDVHPKASHGVRHDTSRGLAPEYHILGGRVKGALFA